MKVKNERKNGKIEARETKKVKQNKERETQYL
jgi:hypothetical protein